MTMTLFAFSLSAWEAGLILLFGLLFAGAGLFLGRTFFARRTIPLQQDYSNRLRELAEKIERDRRVSARHESRQAKMLMTVSGDLEAVHEATVLNHSLGGLCLWVSNPLQIGQGADIRPANEHDKHPWIRVKIKNCRMHRGGWALGCQFADEQAAQVLFG
jgi:hypothetical protein